MPIGDARTPFQPAGGSRPKRRLGRRDAPAVDVDALLDELSREVVRCVARVLSCGGAIHIGSVRSRGALLIRAWVGGDTYEDYVTSVAEFTATLEALDEVTEALMRDHPR